MVGHRKRPRDPVQLVVKFKRWSPQEGQISRSKLHHSAVPSVRFKPLGKLIGDILTGQVEDHAPTPEEQRKDPAAVDRGRLGGLKGGKATASKMTAAERKSIASRAIPTPSM